MQKMLWPCRLFDGWGMDRLDAMQVLLAVVDGGSLSAGGRSLNMSLPTVSRKMAELEARLGTRLMIRTTRNIQLTDAGRDYVEVIRPIVAQLEEAERRAAGEYDEPRGELNITIPGGATRGLALPLSLEFLDEHPKISLNIISDERVVDLVDERVDVGIRLGNLADSSLYAVKVGDVTISTIASPDYLKRKGRPSHPEELSEHDGVLFSSLKPSSWTYLVNGELVESWPRFRVRANRASVLIEAAVKGLGLTRMGRSGIEKELRSGALETVLDQYECAAMGVHLVYVKQGLMPLKVRAFIDWMAPRLRDQLTELNKIRQGATQ
jgi:DNA-binding transcriptional LysR family regulator